MTDEQKYRMGVTILDGIELQIFKLLDTVPECENLKPHYEFIFAGMRTSKELKDPTCMAALFTVLKSVVLLGNEFNDTKCFNLARTVMIYGVAYLIPDLAPQINSPEWKKALEMGTGKGKFRFGGGLPGIAT